MSEEQKISPASPSVPTDEGACNTARCPSVKDILLAGYDVITVTLSYFLALLISFGGAYSGIPFDDKMNFAGIVPIHMVICVAAFTLFGLYGSIRKHTFTALLLRCTCATAVTGVLHTVIITLVFGRMPLAYYCFGIMIQFLTTLGSRACCRFISAKRNDGSTVNIGAGR